MSGSLIVRGKFQGPRRCVAHDLNRVAAAQPIDGLGDREGNLEIAAAISAFGAIEMDVLVHAGHLSTGPHHRRGVFSRVRSVIFTLLFQVDGGRYNCLMRSETFPIDLSKLQPLKLDPAVSRADRRAEGDAPAQHSALPRRHRLLHRAGRREGPVRPHRRRLRHRARGHDHPRLHRQRRAHRAGLLRRGRPPRRDAIPAERAQRRHAGRRSCCTIANTTAACRAIRRKCSRRAWNSASGRLGHLWAFCNGVAMANPGKAVVLLGLRRQPDGRRQRRGRAPRGRQATQRQGAGRRQQRHDRRPSAGVHAGLRPDPHLVRLRPAPPKPPWARISMRCTSICAARSRDPQPARAGHQAADGPGHRRRRGQPARARSAQGRRSPIKYLEKRGGYEQAIEMLKAAKPDKSPLTYQRLERRRQESRRLRQDHQRDSRRHDARSGRIASVRVFDNDLEGSCGLHHIRKNHPEVFVRGGIMERGNFSAAAGFGSTDGQAGHLRHLQRVPRNVHQRDHHGAPEFLQRAGALQPQRRR